MMKTFLTFIILGSQAYGVDTVNRESLQNTCADKLKVNLKSYYNKGATLEIDHLQLTQDDVNTDFVIKCAGGYEKMYDEEYDIRCIDKLMTIYEGSHVNGANQKRIDDELLLNDPLIPAGTHDFLVDSHQENISIQKLSVESFTEKCLTSSNNN